jgi:hypothetical protein
MFAEVRSGRSVRERNVYGRQVEKRIDECDDEGAWRRKSKIVKLKRG